MTDKGFTLKNIAEMMDELAAYAGQTVVVKIGGNSIDEDPGFLSSLAQQLEFLQSRHVSLVVVHGGGPQIDRALNAAGLSARKRVEGRRLTDPPTMAVVSRVVAEISEQVAVELKQRGCSVMAAASVRQCFVVARPLTDDPDDRTGMPDHVNVVELNQARANGRIVVVNSVGRNARGDGININADDCAVAVAMALHAHRLIFATNVAGVCGADKKLIGHLTPQEALALIADGTIAGGMVPKVQSALRALDSGVGGVTIIDAHKRWSLLGEMLTHKGAGTLISA